MIIQSILACYRARPQSVKVVLWASFSSKRSHLYKFQRPVQGWLKEPSFTPSEEQLKIAKLCSKQNVVVSARPGSGKTATAEAIVAAQPGKRVIVLTYSKRLQLETVRRLQPYSNCEVSTFHSMAGKLFKGTVHNDAELWKRKRQFLDSGELPYWSHEAFDIIVLDEFQDCTEILFWLVGCFIQANERAMKKNGPPARLVVLGDELQCIYQFRGADSRYLTLAPELSGTLTPYPFVQVSLSRSFRLSLATVRFINEVFFRGQQYITSNKRGPKPIFIRCYLKKDRPCSELTAKLAALIRQYGAGNSAFIAPSIRTKGPLQQLANMLAMDYCVPIAVSLDDEAPLDERVIRDKLCISTIHQFKGSERDLIIVFGVDASFFRFFGRHHPDDRCPNEVFVALTRAATQLVLVHDEAKSLMPFMSADAIYETATVVNMTANKKRLAPGGAPGRRVQLGLVLPSNSGVRDIVRHVSESKLDEIVAQHLFVQTISSSLPEQEHIAMRNIVATGPTMGLYESVSDINGIVVVAAFEYQITGQLRSLGQTWGLMGTETPPTDSQKRIAWLCRRACNYEALISGYLPRPIQMKYHDFLWIEPEELTQALKRLQGVLGDSTPCLQFEVDATKKVSVDGETTTLFGRADIVSMPPASADCCDGARDTAIDTREQGIVETVWEIKFVAKLSSEHIVQACAYAYLMSAKLGNVPCVMLFNVRDGERWRVTPRDGLDGLRHVVESALRLRYTKMDGLTTEELVWQCIKASLELVNAGSSTAEKPFSRQAYRW